MKKQITTLLIILLTAYQGISQNSSDSVTCIPNSQLKKAINLIEKGKVVEEELNVTKELLKNSESRLSIKDSIIGKYQLSEKQYKSLVANFEQNLNNDKRIIYNLETQIKLSKKIARRQKLSKYIVGILGVSIGYLIAK
jgi:hypothetical protein